MEITDRATVVIDKSGVIRFSESVTPAGHRQVADLLGICKDVQAAQQQTQLARRAGILVA